VYEKLPEQRHLRQILVKLPHDANDAADKAARAKADGLAEKLKKGAKATGKDGLTFTELARDASDDTVSKARGGDLGWRGRGATNVPSDLEDKIWSAKTGAVVGPLKGNDGYVITKIEGERKGNIPYDQAKLELAEEKLREVRGDELAKAAAADALAKLKADPTKSMKDVFPTPSDSDEAKATADATPRVEETGLFAVRASHDGAVVEGIGVSTPLAKAAFALTPAAPLAGPFDVSGTSVVVRLKDRKDPDLADFEKRKLELTREAELTKWEGVMTDWTQARCLEVKGAKRLSINADVLRYEESSEPPSYEPCVPRHLLGG